MNQKTKARTSESGDSMDNMPKVSVVIPMYNAAPFIERAVMSAVNQTYKNLEIIVVDNCSDDGSAEIVEKIGDSRIRLIRNETNIGFRGNVNKCMEVADGEYIKFLCADDTLMPDCVERCVVKAVNDKADLIYCNYEVIDADDNKVYDKSSYSKDLDLAFNRENAAKILTEQYRISCCITFLFVKNENLPEFVLIDESSYNSDLVLLFDLYKQFGRLCYISEKLTTSRRHSMQGTYTSSGNEIFRMPLVFRDYIQEKCGFRVSLASKFRYKFMIFKNGMNAFLRYQKKLPPSIFGYTMKAFGPIYYIILAFYFPFVYLPKKAVQNIKKRADGKKKKKSAQHAKG